MKETRPSERRYTTAEYAEKNPGWHIENSGWKAEQVLSFIREHELEPRTICEVGCGAGEILKEISQALTAGMFVGYEISPHAFELCQQRANDRLSFRLARPEDDLDTFDLMLLLDVIEHVDDYLGFLRVLRTKSDLKIMHIPLEISVQMILRPDGLSSRRRDVGHLHFFTKATALDALEEAGYEILDHRYTPSSIHAPKTLRAHIAAPIRKVLFRLNEDTTVRILGGFSLLVLAR